MTSRTPKRMPLVLLALVCLVPAVQTAVSVYWQWHTVITYPALKALMIAVPVVVWLTSGRTRAEVKELVGWKRTSFRPGLAVGGLSAGVILTGYYVLFRPMIDPTPVADKVRSLGVLRYYWAMALVIALWNSLYEEYYWRGFILGEFRAWTQKLWAPCVIGGALFGIHHIFAVLPVFRLPLVAMCVLGTMVAGGVWSWMRLRGLSILDCYLSHVLANLSIMWIGYDLIVRATRGA